MHNCHKDKYMYCGMLMIRIYKINDMIIILERVM